MAYLNRDWLINNIGGVDQWIYTGYFLHYDDPLFLPFNKKLARLPWILSGFFLNKAFSPAIATQLLHGGYFFLSCAGVYLAIRQFLLSRTVAILLSLFCLFCAEQWGPKQAGWDYHDVAGGVFYIFTYVALGFAAARNAAVTFAFFAAGILLALAVHTNILVLNLIPVLAIHVVGVAKGQNPGSTNDKRWWAAAIAGSCFGVIVCTVALGLINMSWGRQFLFFENLVIRSRELILDPNQQIWWEKWGSFWWARQTDMALYGGVFLLAVGSLVPSLFRRRNFWADVTNAPLLGYVVAFVIFLFWQIGGQTALQPNYMAYPLMFPMVFALAAVTVRVLRGTEAGQVALWSWVCGILFVVYLLFAKPIEAFAPSSVADQVRQAFGENYFAAIPPFLFLVCGMTLSIGLAFLLKREVVAQQTRNIALFLCVTAVLAVTDREIAYADYVRFRSLCITKLPIYEAVVASSRFLHHEVNPKYKINLWYHPDEQIGAAGCGGRVDASDLGAPVVSTGMEWITSPSIAIKTVADIPTADLDAIHPNRDVAAVISGASVGSVVELADRLTEATGVPWRLFQSQSFTHGSMRFVVTIIAASQDAMVSGRRQDGR